MTPTEQADQLELAAKILREGLEWDGGTLDEFGLPLSLFRCLELGRRIRIKPPAPVPVPEGYRELSDGEKQGQWVDGGKYLESGIWLYLDEDGCWASPNKRIIAPIPPKQVPLEASDVPPGSVIRLKTNLMGYLYWVAVTHCGPSGLGYNNGAFGEVLSYSELFDNWELKRPTDTEWQPCSKPEPTKP